MVTPQLCNKVIKIAFYSLFVSVPLVFAPWTSELFEFNKMWVTFLITIIIGLSWIIKSLLTGSFHIQRTPLDLPIGLFLLSQFISTLISLDTHTSVWGYYSRFNGGLLSIFSYVFIYYAFLSNFNKDELVKIVQKILKLSLITGIIVALWGLPSHFGFDPTCLLFKGAFDVSCWTEDFQPKVRIFSTLGQPAWLGAYLALLVSIALYYVLSSKYKVLYLLLATLFYLDLLYTRSRAAFIATWLSLALLGLWHFWRRDLPFSKSTILEQFRKSFRIFETKVFLGTLFVFLLITFVVETPFAQLNRFTLDGIKNPKVQTSEQRTGSFSTGGGGTDSGKIRLYVWKGAFDIFKNYPLFGSGVETYAFAYYRFRPVEHNLTSEWNFIYNKAHNEYLNYLATTGAFGLSTYLFMIGLFLWIAIRYVLRKKDLLIAAIISSYLTILITNFFGFSVVIVNIYLFMIPALVFVLAGNLNYKQRTELSFPKTLSFRKISVFGSAIIALYLIIYLLNLWTSDVFYALGSNLNRAGEYQQAFEYLRTASMRSSSEPTFKDEYAANLAVLSVAYAQDEASESAKISSDIAKEAVTTSTFLITEHPNNVVFLKNQIRVFSILSLIDQEFLSHALNLAKRTQKLAPTDVGLSYRLGILYGQSKDYKKAVEALEQTIKLKPNYIDAHYELGRYYHLSAVNERGVVINFELQQKAIEEMKYILEKLDPKNSLAREALEGWQQELPSPEK